MEKILLKEAINNQRVYVIDNKDEYLIANKEEYIFTGRKMYYTDEYLVNNKSHYISSQLYYLLINGKIRFINFKKRDVSKDDILDMPINPKENKIIEIEIEYKNLNKFDTSTGIFMYNECYLVDSMGYHFKTYSYSNDNETDYFVPKIWKKIKLIFLVPDEESDYYFKVDKLNIVEEEMS